MSALISPERDILKRDRIVAIGGKPELPDFLRRRYPDLTVATAKSMLEGIDSLANEAARAVIAFVDHETPRLSDAVAGLRDAAGRNTRVLLCCDADVEPVARRATEAGADDYLILPLDGLELDAAIGYARAEDIRKPEDGTPAATMEELNLLADLLENLDADGFTVLNKLAELVRVAMKANATTIVVEGSVANAGSAVIEPVLVEPIKHGDRNMGQITIGGRDVPYGSGDLEKLKHYASLSGHLLSAANMQRKWRKDAMTDPVSGLYNRRYLKTFLNDLLDRAREGRFRITVLLFDIDNFKKYNDTYGHAAGDEIINRVGTLFKAHSRDHDIVTRHGGDEFCVVFWDADQPRVAGSEHPSDALEVLRRFREALKSEHCDRLSPSAQGQLTISGGLASFPWDASTADELLEHADEALLQAKRAGKNQVFVFDRNQSAKQ